MGRQRNKSLFTKPSKLNLQIIETLNLGKKSYENNS